MDGTFAPLSARTTATSHDSADPASGTISYTVESGYCRPLSPRGVAILFGDHAGNLIGGSFDIGNKQQTCSPGRSTAQALAALSLPADSDDSKTEVHPGCDLAPAGPTTGPGGPGN